MELKIDFTTIVISLISSPFVFALFEYIKDKAAAFYRYRKWQAIFLDNGQVYFGKIASVSRNDIVLKNIFYLQEKEISHISPISLKESDVELVKLGNEIHSPKDNMTIGRAHITFMEHLKDDSDMVKLMKKNLQL